MECPCCGKAYSPFSEDNEIMKLNEFRQFLCTQCYTPLNKKIEVGINSAISLSERNKTE